MATDNQVTIEFGAKIDKLVDGIDSVKHQLEGLRSSVGTVGEGFKAIAEIIGVAFTVEGIKRFVESMAELGLQTEVVMGQLGQSAEQVGVLSGIAKVTGTSLEGLALSISRMSLNVQRSTADALNPQAQALKLLGLNAKDLIGLPADQYFVKLSEAVSKFNPSLNLTNALMVIGGRGVAQMIPALQLGAEGFRRWQEQIKLAQNGLAAAVPGMADTHTKIELMSLSMQSLGARIFTVLKPAIDWAITAFTKFVQSLDAKTIQTAVANVVQWVGAAVISVGTFFQWLIESIDSAIRKMAEFASRARNTAAGAAGGGLAGLIGGGVVGGPIGAVAGGVGGALVGGLLGSSDAAARVGDAFDAIGKEVDKFKGTEPAWAASVRKAMADLMDAINNPDAHGAAAGGKAAAGAIDEGLRNKLAAAMERIQAEIGAIQGALEQKKILYDLDAALWKTTEQQKLAATMAATREAFQAEAVKLQQMRDLWPAHSREWEALNRRMLDATRAFNTEMLRLNADSLKDQQKKWSDMFSAIQSSFNSSLRGLLAGTTSWMQAFKQIGADMVIYFIQLVEKMAFEWAAGQLAQLTATVSTEGAKTAAVAAGSAAQSAAQLPTIISGIMASVGKVFAGVSGWFAPILGPAAPAAGAAVAAAVETSAMGYMFEKGAWEIPGAMQATLHPKEMVLPAGPAEAFRSMAEGGGMGGGDTHFHIDAVDARSFTQMLQNNSGALVQLLKNATRNNQIKMA